MGAPLDEWQARLDRHFAGLRAERGDRPLFALEHGLTSEEAEALATAVRAQIRSTTPTTRHALPWIVYAAEIGYGYEGDEYWQTFEQRTPGWTLRGTREWIRDRYEQFHRKYGGAAPSGPWAKQFSIICWPITHAILPTDLQRQLAHILYDLRDSFSAELFESPTTLGEFIAARSFNATSRFKNLTQEPQLIGQIAAALLLQGQFGTAGLLHPAALRRIGADLERERVARVWLNSARKAAQERATVRGLYFGRGALSVPRRPEEARAEISALGIEPRLVLRPTSSQRASWEVCLEIPDLSHLLLRFPSTREVLAESRCVVAGRRGGPLPRGQFLYGSKRVVLSRWPRPDEVLLQFERRDPHLEFLLRTDCMLRPSPMRLFRIATDGLAYESRSLRVRAGESYVVVRGAAFPAAPGITTVDLSCEGMYGGMFTLPAALTAAWETMLTQLGLSQARAIEVWPAGIAAAQWDGEGHGEWLASEQPCLGIATDHSVAAVVVSIGPGSEPSLVLDRIRPGQPEFIELPRLPVGLHRLRFSTRRTETVTAESVGDLDVLMRIREARPWSPAAGAQGPLLARIDPPIPTLEQLWEGRAEIAIEGPPGRQVRCDATLFESTTRARSISKTLPPLVLPVDSPTWSRHFEQHFCNDKKAEAAYDTARSCELKFTAEELGAFTLRCEREFSPLRWNVRREGPGYAVRLLNDSGNATVPVISRISFETPLQEEVLEGDSPYSAPRSGGLFVARVASAVAAVVVSPIVEDLSEFGCTPRVSIADRAPDTLYRILAKSELWGHAKLSGSVFAATRQNQVLTAIDAQVAGRLCGTEWMRTEQRYRTGAMTFGYLQRAVWRANHEAEAGVRISRRYVELSTADLPARIREIAGIARVLGVANSTVAEAQLNWTAEFALRIVSDPASVTTWSKTAFRDGLSTLDAFPTLARAARCLVVAIDQQLRPHGAYKELYASWRWQ